MADMVIGRDEIAVVRPASGNRMVKAPRLLRMLLDAICFAVERSDPWLFGKDRPPCIGFENNGLSSDILISL
jgi:hypothetical protein